MGKRELVIIVGFVLVGVVAYQLAAPPAVEGTGFSLSRLIQGVKREVNPASASYVHRGAWPAPGSLREIRLDRVRQVTVTGEERTDIAYELSVESSGPDTETAEAYARRTSIETDDLGDALGLAIEYPEEAVQTASLVLRVPARMALRLAGRVQSTVTDVAAVHFDRATGEAQVTGVAGSVTGTHLGGRLQIRGADELDLTLRASRATISGIRRGLRLNATSGELTVADSVGPLEIEQQSTETRISGHDGPITVSGSGGEVTVQGATAEVRIDVRRCAVEVSLDRAAPLTLLTTDDVLRILIDDSWALQVDAAATRGDVQAGDFGLTPETSGPDAKLTHQFGPAGGRASRIVARNDRGDVVLRKRK